MCKTFSCIFYIAFLSLVPFRVFADEIRQHFSLDGLLSDIDAGEYLPYVLGSETKLEPLPAPMTALSPAEKIVWSANKMELKAYIREIHLRFSHPTRPDAPPFEISFFFTQPGAFHSASVVVRHSKPAHARERGGVKFESRGQSKQDVRVFLYESAGDVPHVKLFLPKGRENEEHEAMLLCLRDTEQVLSEDSEDKKVIGEVLVPHTGYLLDKMTTRGDFSASGQMVSGLGASYGLAVLQTTENIYPSFPYLDRVLAEDPSVSLYYAPQQSKAIRTSEDGKIGAIAGFRARLDFVNPAGYRRQFLRDTFVAVKRLSAQDKGSFVFPNTQELDTLEGCSLFVRRSREGDAYTKQEAPSKEGLAKFGGDDLVFSPQLHQ